MMQSKRVISPLEKESTVILMKDKNQPDEKPEQAPLILRLKEPENKRPHVSWTEDTIDNEHLGRLKSNCCCIWVEPHVWNDPSTWEQDECETEHCRGHSLPEPPQATEKDSSVPEKGC